jgi:cytochrome c peroxidase
MNLADNASLASQAVGPIVSGVEMSCAGRTLPDVGKKLLGRRPLALQHVDPNDSALGMLAAGSAPTDLGTTCGDHACTYQELVVAAFGAQLAAGAETAFARVWGQALAAYMATLVPSATPLDHFLAGQGGAMTQNQLAGLDVFLNRGECASCHEGPETTDASVTAALGGLINISGGDLGFHNTGVRPTADDLGRAGLGPRGATFSRTTSTFNRGAFKTPTLRNVKLTAPYFHDGGKATIANVVDFYSRGGDFQNAELDPDMHAFGFSSSERDALVDFLTNALTDPRAEGECAPFDHPSLMVTDGPEVAATGASGTGNCQ